MPTTIIRHPSGHNFRSRGKVGGWAHYGCNCTPINLDHWRQLCEWLENQPYNASYDGPRNLGVGHLLDTPNKDGRAGREAADERSRVELIFWSTGHGWRLHKGWRERLAELEREADHG